VSITNPGRRRSYGDTVRTGRRVIYAAGALAVVIAVSACSSDGSNAKQTTTPTSSPASSRVSSKPATPSPAQKLMTKLSGNCDSLLPQVDVEDTMGVHFAGKNAFVVGVPEKNIGRLSYLNCRYGISAAAGGTPATEIGVSLYDTPSQAQTRLAGTIDDYRSHGATQTPATVSGMSATLLTGGTGTGYDIPLLVVAAGQRTVAVSVVDKLLAPGRRGPVMAKVAALALQQTAP
jgi:hypothetical protein